MKKLLPLLLMFVSPLAFAAVINLSSVGPALLFLVGWALILYVLWWGLNKINPDEPWKTIGVVILVILTVAILIDFIATVFFGTALVTFR